MERGEVGGGEETNCGDDKFIEMHHIKHIKTINPKLSSFDKMLAKINRKQVPLCRVCVRRLTYYTPETVTGSPGISKTLMVLTLISFLGSGDWVRDNRYL